MSNRIKFVLNGCDIHFVAEAPEDMTLKQLLKQCDRIQPDYCACGLRSFDEDFDLDYNSDIEPAPPKDPEVMFEYEDVWRTNPCVDCRIWDKDYNGYIEEEWGDLDVSRYFKI